MLSTLSSLALFALAGALSTVPVSVTIMILLSPSPRRGALPFLIGSLAGSIVVVGLAAVGLQFLPVKPPRLRKDEWVAQFAIVIGALLIAYAVYLLVSKGGRDNAMLGKMKSRFRSARPWEFVVLGLGFNLRPEGTPAGRHRRCRDRCPGTAAAAKQPACPRLRRRGPVSRHHSGRRVAALPRAGPSAFDRPVQLAAAQWPQDRGDRDADDWDLPRRLQPSPALIGLPRNHAPRRIPGNSAVRGAPGRSPLWTSAQDAPLAGAGGLGVRDPHHAERSDRARRGRQGSGRTVRSGGPGAVPPC